VQFSGCSTAAQQSFIAISLPFRRQFSGISAASQRHPSGISTGQHG
jgi:hypothetical protein